GGAGADLHRRRRIFPAREGGALMTRSRTAHKVLLFIGALLVAAVMFLPIYAAFVGSLTELRNLGGGYLFPTDWQWENRSKFWSRISLARYLLTATLYSLAVAALAVAISVFGSYAVWMFTVLGQRAFLYVLLLSQVVPAIVLVI